MQPLLPSLRACPAIYESTRGISLSNREHKSTEPEDKTQQQGCLSCFEVQYSYLVPQYSYIAAQDNYSVLQDEELVRER